MTKMAQTETAWPEGELSCPSRARKGRIRLSGPSVLSLLGLGLFWGCGATSEAPEPTPAGIDLDALASRALAATMPETPVQITFDFRLKEADLRFAGRGVARVEPPYRVRIDLYSNGGEGLFRAALVGSDLRVPLGVPRELAPPPGLMWAALGVFRPDADLHLMGGRSTGKGNVTLYYGGGKGQDLRFLLTGDRLTRAEIHQDDHLVEEVDLVFDESSGEVVETVYRNRAMFLELTFSLKSVETVGSFPPEIWDPGR